MSTNCTTPPAPEGACLDAFDTFRTNIVVSYIATIWLVDTILLIAILPLLLLFMNYLRKRRGPTAGNTGPQVTDMETQTHHVEPDLEQGDGVVVDAEKGTGRDSTETMVDSEYQNGEIKS